MVSESAMISFVVPAYNEQRLLGRTLQAIHESMRVVAQPYEIVVADDASTDATAEIARANNARVIRVEHRQIAATRNSGARAAKGDRLFFVDADTIINPRTVASALRAMEKGALGGGAPAWFEEKELVPLYFRPLRPLAILVPKLAGFTGGACMFCTREAFRATGGFDERLYWADEIAFALALKREGRFVVLWDRVSTSARRLRKISGLQLLAGGVRLLFTPRKVFTDRSLVENVWYDPNRADDDKPPNSLLARVSNALGLLIIFVIITEPIWTFVPRSLTPLSSCQGKIRFLVGFFLCHLGLVCWPIALVLFANVLRQKRLTGLIQSTGLIAFFVWQAWGATHGVIRIWTLFGHWLA